jgi:hypothetical protein
MVLETTSNTKSNTNFQNKFKLQHFNGHHGEQNISFQTMYCTVNWQGMAMLLIMMSCWKGCQINNLVTTVLLEK